MLHDKYAKDISTLLLPIDCYNPYPKYNERDKWDEIPQLIKNALIKRGEKYIDYKFEPVLASDLIKAASSTYNLSFITKSIDNLKALMECTIAECAEGKGRFLSQILDGVMIKCEESWWNYTASAYMHQSYPCVFPDIEDPIIDLPSARTGNYLAIIYYLFISEFDKIDQNIGKRIKLEVKKRLFKPFYERDDIWWMAYTRKINPVMQILHPINNWTPYCVKHCTNAILLLEDDWKKRQDGILKSMSIMDNYINYYSNDGCCDEGISYWYMAPGALIDYLTNLYDVSGGEINIFDQEKIVEMGNFVYKASVGDSYYVSYADSHGVFKTTNNKAIEYARKTKNDTLLRFALHSYNKDTCLASIQNEMDIENTFYIALNFEKIENNFYLNDTTSKDYLLKDHYYSDCQIMASREQKSDDSGFFVSAKGGHNDESHNHNDVGNFVIFNDKKPVIIDAGVGEYTKKTFSKQRYDIWTMQSEYHNVPVVNGYPQKVGHTFKATDVKYLKSDKQSSLSMNLKYAYKEQAGINKYIRKIALNRGENTTVTITEHISLFKSSDMLSFTFLTPATVLEDKKGELHINNTILQYDSNMFKPSFEIKKLSEPLLQKYWGETLTKISFSLIAPIKEESFTFTFIKAE